MARSARVRVMLGSSLLAGVTLVGALTAAAPGASAATTLSPAYPPLYVKAIQDALAARSFHEVSTVDSSGFHSQGSEDAVVNGGVEWVTIRDTARASATATPVTTTFGFVARLYNAHLYLNADQLTLTEIVGLSNFQGGFNAGHWLVVPTSSPVFNELAYGIDVTSGISQVELAPPVAVGAATTYRGVRVVPLSSHGGIHASATNSALTGQFTLYVTAGANPRPVAETVTDTVNKVLQHVTFAFSEWGAKVAITKPANSIPLPT